MTSTYEVDTPVGPGRWYLDPAPEPVATLLLGHGAGGGVQAPDLVALARGLPERGVTVARFEQPWRTAGRRVAAPPATLDRAWCAASAWLAAQLGSTGPLLLGGRSAGARVACRTAGALGAAGVVCLAFPLHPPGRPGVSRAGELRAPAVPRLVLQGTRDTFGGPAEVSAAAPGVRVVPLPGADHGFRLPARATPTPAELRALLVAEVTEFVTRAGGW